MLTSQRRTASARAHSDCILFYMTVESFEEVIKDYPKYYDHILDKATTYYLTTLPPSTLPSPYFLLTLALIPNPNPNPNPNPSPQPYHLNQAMERLENTLRSNASMELRLQQLDIKKDILRNKMQKGLGTRRASQIKMDP